MPQTISKFLFEDLYGCTVQMREKNAGLQKAVSEIRDPFSYGQEGYFKQMRSQPFAGAEAMMNQQQHSQQQHSKYIPPWILEKSHACDIQWCLRPTAEDEVYCPRCRHNIDSWKKEKSDG